MTEEIGFAVWLTGLPASGKSTLANLLAQEIDALGLPVQVLDSDELRQVLTPQPTYRPEERKWFYDSLAYIGKLLAQNGVHVIFAATAHRRDYRQRARRYFPRFVEVYVKCPVETCVQRDQKSLYQKALSGEIHSLPGVQELYEEPVAPAVLVDTGESEPQACLEEILNWLRKFEYIPQRDKSTQPIDETLIYRR
jgi:adenylylsulfate kinase